MYLAWAQRRCFSTQLVDERRGREGGLRSGTWIVHGSRAYGLLACETGAHRVAHRSRFGDRGKRQTSRASVSVLPHRLLERASLDLRDVDIVAYSGSSKGGQHANRSATNIRATHRPSGLTAQSQGRSQAANRRAALEVLAARVAGLGGQVGVTDRVSAGFGCRVRSYTLAPYTQVVDERVHFKSPRAAEILDGDLDGLLLRLAMWRATAEAGVERM